MKSGRRCRSFEVPRENPTRIVNGISFVHGVTGGAATSHQIGTHLYRAFRRGKCYELAINITQSAFGVHPAGTIREFSAQDEERVRRALPNVVDSFRVLR